MVIFQVCTGCREIGIPCYVAGEVMCDCDAAREYTHHTGSPGGRGEPGLCNCVCVIVILAATDFYPPPVSSCEEVALVLRL